jgi:hypothetical protein
MFPANAVDLNPDLTVTPTEVVSLLLGWKLLWRHRRADALYAPHCWRRWPSTRRPSLTLK